MSVIAWDGQMLAVDRCATSSSIRLAHHKTRIIASPKTGLTVAVLACTGQLDIAQVLFGWYVGGASPAEWPTWCQRDESLWGRLVEWRPSPSYSGLYEYNRAPQPINWSEAKQIAWGSGSEIALGAMMAGATAARAVEIAGRLSTDCGMGVDAFVYREDVGIVPALTEESP